MQTLVKEGKYKVIDYLSNDEDYASATAVDIEDNEHRRVLINSYTNPQDIRRLVPLYYNVSKSGYADFIEYFTEYSKINVVFKYHAGKKLTQVFGNGDIELTTRLAMEEKLLHEAVLMSCMPQEILYATLRKENAVVNHESGTLKFNMLAPPRNIEKNEWLLDQLSEMTEIVLKRRFTSLSGELDFMDELRTGGYESLAAVYSAWRELWIDIEQRYKEREKMGEVAIFFDSLKTFFVRLGKSKRYKRLYKERLKISNR